MKLIKDTWEENAFTFLKDKDFDKVEEMIDEYGSDEELIGGKLMEKYPEDKYFVLVDYIDENNGYFRIRVWKK